VMRGIGEAAGEMGGLRGHYWGRRKGVYSRLGSNVVVGVG